MRFWWVNQNKTWAHERRGGYLWAPLEGMDGRDLFHWKNMEEVEAGDVIFSFAKSRICAVSIARFHAYYSEIPPEFGVDAPWKQMGRRLDVEYYDISEQLSLRDILPISRSDVGMYRGPIQKSGLRANQSYLHEISATFAVALLNKIGLEHILQSGPEDRTFNEIDADESTTRLQLIEARKKQGKFRENLIRAWGSCGVTGASNTTLLVASHIKPWKWSTNEQRIDPNNGLLLSAAYDRAFDRGLISFDSEGCLLHNPDNEVDLVRIGIQPRTKLSRYSDEIDAYMSFHRERCFVM